MEWKSQKIRLSLSPQQCYMIAKGLASAMEHPKYSIYAGLKELRMDFELLANSEFMKAIELTLIQNNENHIKDLNVDCYDNNGNIKKELVKLVEHNQTNMVQEN